MRLLTIIILIGLIGCTTEKPAYQNTDLTVDQRVEDLLSRMTLEEKISQMSDESPAIEKFGIQKYKWWNECVHGVVMKDATVFPQAIGMASTWDEDLIFRVATAISDEARAAYHQRYGHGNKEIPITPEQVEYDINEKYVEDIEYSSFKISGLTFWTPVINIGRDPRWGRTQESWGEDPHFVSKMGVAFVKGLQGDDPNYLKVVSTPKHFAVNNEEWNRHFGSANVSERMLREYYLPHFEASIREGKAHSVMSAYNAVNGVPVSASTEMLTDILRDEWGFDGYVVSDCGAVADVVFDHKYITDPEKAVAEVIKAGLDLECECCGKEESLFDNYLKSAVEKGYITEKEIDRAVGRLMAARFRLGMFDPPELIPYSQISEDIIEGEEHQQLALETARKSMILLENKNNFLPLNKEKVKTVAVIGPNANVCRYGNYTGVPSNPITPLEGIRSIVGPDVEVKYALGCDLDTTTVYTDDLKIAEGADVVILAMGTNLKIETEETDRTSLDLPDNQVKLIQEVYKRNKNVVLVLINGSPLATNWSSANVPAIIEAWYPGQSGGQAIAEVIFGEYNPAGRLPMTAYKSVDQLQDFSEYDISKGQTYMYLEEEPIYPFGYGLSYTSFAYENLKINSTNTSVNEGEIAVTVELDVTNTGDFDGDEVIQVYVKDKASSVIQPIKELRGFKRVSLAKNGGKQTVSFGLSNADFSFWDESQKGWTIEPGEFEIQVGGSSKDIRLTGTLSIN